MKKVTISCLIISIISLTSCHQGWYDGSKHKTTKKPITHKVKPHQSAPKH